MGNTAKKKKKLHQDFMHPQYFTYLLFLLCLTILLFFSNMDLFFHFKNINVLHCSSTNFNTRKPKKPAWILKNINDIYLKLALFLRSSRLQNNVILKFTP